VAREGDIFKKKKLAKNAGQKNGRHGRQAVIFCPPFFCLLFFHSVAFGPMFDVAEAPLRHCGFA
jgi:hypothetical protein